MAMLDMDFWDLKSTNLEIFKFGKQSSILSLASDAGRGHIVFCFIEQVENNINLFCNYLLKLFGIESNQNLSWLMVKVTTWHKN